MHSIILKIIILSVISMIPGFMDSPESSISRSDAKHEKPLSLKPLKTNNFNHMQHEQ